MSEMDNKISRTLVDAGLLRPKSHIFDRVIEADLSYITAALRPLIAKVWEQGHLQVCVGCNCDYDRINPYRIHRSQP